MVFNRNLKFLGNFKKNMSINTILFALDSNDP